MSIENVIRDELFTSVDFYLLLLQCCVICVLFNLRFEENIVVYRSLSLISVFDNRI